jgi:hypothetical protein
MKTKKSERHKPASLDRKDPHNWNFYDVPTEQRSICCFWEYARESASLRKAVALAKTAFANVGIAKPETAEREAFRVKVNEAYALLVKTGFDLPFWVRLPFPKPWLSVDKVERSKWAHVRREIPNPVKHPPFQVTGDGFIIAALNGLAHEAYKTNMAVLAKAESDPDINTTEALAECFDPHPVSLLGTCVQSFVAQINWRDYTKREIKNAIWKWIEANRPPTIPDPSGRGHNPMEECRASLERLALLRLRSCYTLDETLAILAKRPKEQRQTSKFVNPGECNREAEKAVADFHELLHFLDPTDMPRSWPLK